ncbi:MAG: glycosyltransferase family 2 protein, partial [Nevskiales bacterium]
HGRIDFLGYQTPGHAWFFCGWVAPGHAALDGKITAIAYFERGQVAGAALVGTYEREDLAGSGLGIALCLDGPGRPMGELISLSIGGEGAAWTLFPSEAAPMLRDAELALPLRPVLGRLRAGGSKATMVGLAGRHGWTGANTLGELRDRVLVEVDETIFCPPNGVMLVGWMLAQPGVVKFMRLQSGHNSAVLQPENFLRLDRPDVLSSVGVQHGLQELRSGFLLFVPGVYVPGDTTYLAVETARGEVGYRGVTEPKLRGMQAIRFILDRFDVRYDELVRVFDHVVGPSIASLNRDRLGEKVEHEVIDFGRMPAAPVVSVIVPLYGRLDFMEYQFGLFSRHQDGIAHEFIFVLDDPTRQREAEQLAASIFARFGIPLRLVVLSRNRGFGPANNIGVGLARGRYVCFMNSDVFPDTDDWIERLVARLAANPGIGALGPLLLYEDRSVQHLGMSFEKLAEFGGWMFPRHDRKGWRRPAEGGLRRCAAITGACMMIERRLVRELGGFDESFIIGDFEDSDLCLKIAERGLGCAVDLDVSMYHLERQSQAGPEQRWRMNLTLYNAWVHEGRWGARLRERAAPSPDVVAEPAAATVAEPATAEQPA